VHHGWHGTHRYDIKVFATHASTWVVHRYSLLLQWSVPKGMDITRGKSVVTVQRAFRVKYSSDQCHVTSLAWWHGSLQQWRISMHPFWRVCGKNLNIVSCVPCHPLCTYRTYLVVKKPFFSFPVTVNNSIKVGSMVSLLQIFVITENIMKRPAFQAKYIMPFTKLL
jgi:hypothetical protein